MNRRDPEHQTEHPDNDSTPGSSVSPVPPPRRRKPPIIQPKGRGRPRKFKPSTSLIVTLFNNKVGRPKQHKVDDRRIVDLVDGHKGEAGSADILPMTDARALAELLYRYAPPQIRRDLDQRLAFHHNGAETKYAQKHALHRAVLDVEGARFEWWIKRLSRARSNLQKSAK